MATMYVYNIPTNETVNLRKTPSTSGTILVRVGYGKAVQASYYNSTWHSASYSGYSGYIMSKFLSSTDPDGGGSSGGGGGTPTAGVIQGTSVRVRSQPNTSSTILTQVNTGDKVTYYAGETYSGSGYTWYRCTGSKWSGDGYIATNYVVKDNGGGGTGGGGSYLGQGTVIGGGPLYCRKQPQAGYESWGQFQEGTVIPIYSCSTSGWYETRWPASGSNVGYVMSQFISLNSGGGGTTTNYTFLPSDAVTYALNHSDNSSGTCTKRNTSFKGIDGNDDCADFVHQCICAGGVPMFNGWFYRLSGIPASWSDSKWSLTQSGYQRLDGKGWLQTVAYNAVQPGDLIYSYDPNATPTPYTHVTIAVSNNITENGKFGCKVCGNTTNQHDKFKELTSSNCRCYRVKGNLSGDGSEKRVSLPLNGNGATVL